MTDLPTPPPPLSRWTRFLHAAAPAFPWMAGGLVALVVGSWGSRLLNPLPVSTYSTFTLGFFYFGEIAIAAVLVWAHHRYNRPAPRRAHTTPPPDPRVPAAMVPEEPEIPSGPADEDTTTMHPTIARVRAVLDDFFPGVYVRQASVEYNDEGEVRAFTLKNSKSGGFNSESDVEKLYGRVNRSLEGVWNMSTDTIADSVTLSLKDGFPRAISLPIPDDVVTSPKQALTVYPKHRLRLGVDESGTVLSVSMRSFPHGLIVGCTGSGKSVFVRTVIEDFRSAGWMVLLGDGKGTDYTGLISCPNVVMVSQETPDHIRLVKMFADEVLARKADARHNQRNNPDEPPFNRPPMILILDEFAEMVKAVENDYDLDRFMNDLLYIGRLGRQFKCHMIIATQEVYRGILPGPLLGAMKFKVSLGPPETKTIQEVFPQNMTREAKRIGGGIDKERDPGRGLVLLQDDKSGNRIVEFQSFYGYSPADPELPPSILQADHDRYQAAVSDQIPKMYPRLWFAVDGPGYADDLDHLLALPIVSLDGPDGSPDPANDQYDPLSDRYNGNDDDTPTRAPFPALDEMAQGKTLPPPPVPAADDDHDDPPWDTTPPPAPEYEYSGPHDFDSPGPPPDWATEPAATEPSASEIDTEPTDTDRPRPNRNTGVVGI